MKRFAKSFVLCAVVMSLFSTGAFAFGQNKIVYDKFDWSIYQSTHFEIYYYETEKESLQKMVNFAESAYDELSRKFNFQIPKRVPLIFYATHSAFEQTNVELGFIPEGVGAFATSVRNRMVLPIDLPDPQLLALIKHELTHIFQYEILFQGKLAQELRARPPTWIMEGMASFMAEDEDSRDRMFLRDAVVNDQIPSITRDVQGYFAYRFGHAVFRYIVERWDWDGLRDFIYEYRGSLGGGIARPLKRAFDVTPEEFDTGFRTWLRRHYLPTLVQKGEPTEFGEIFTVNKDIASQETSPVPSPSGDLLVALTTYKQDVDVVLMNVPERKLIRNLSSGLPEEYEYIVSQSLTIGPIAGRDVAFGPSGDQIAFFVKKARGRNLLIVNGLTGQIDKSVPMKIEQQLNPTFSPDGKKIAFHGFEGNRADIFTYDLASGGISNLTNDDFYDVAPVYSPDGKWLYYSSVVEGHTKIFRLDVSNPTTRQQVTRGDSNDIDAWISPDGKRLFYSSDLDTGRLEKLEKLQKAVAEIEGGADGEIKATGDEDTPGQENEGEEGPTKLDPRDFAIFNIYSIDLETGERRLYTDVVGGSFAPVVFTGAGGKEKLIFSSFYKGRWRLYSTLTEKSIRKVDTVPLPDAGMAKQDRKVFEPPIEVAIDPENIKDYGRFKLFIDDIQVNAGVTSDQTFVSRSVIFMSDMLGDRRFIVALDSVSSFANFDFIYLDLRKRLNWGLRLVDDRTYFVTQDLQGQTDSDLTYRTTALMGFLSYPFDRYRRVEFGAGYYFREYNQPFIANDGTIQYVGYKDDFPFIQTSLSGDSTQYRQFGPIAGRAYQLNVGYAPDIDNGGTLTNDYTLELRQYLQLSNRSLLAARGFAGYATGNVHNYYYFGGLNTLRGYDFRTIVGDRAFYANFEVRFPLIDVLATPIINFTGIRGSLFFDIGGAYFEGQDYEFWNDGKLEDGLASVGFGFSVNFFGLELHWDFARRTDLKTIDDETMTSFWIGQTF